MEGLKDRS